MPREYPGTLPHPIGYTLLFPRPGLAGVGGIAVIHPGYLRRVGTHIRMS